MNYRLYAASVFLLWPFVIASSGEIVLDVPSARAVNTGKVDNISRARLELRGEDPNLSAASSVITDTGAGDDYFPQRGDTSTLTGKASDLRNVAKERQSNGIVLPGNEKNSVMDNSSDVAAREGAINNVSKARAYTKNLTAKNIAELPVVSCDSSNNVTGRIGDDTLSGSIVTIMINHKQVQARCK
jgi:hypothetical protein